jgi:signal transduction histidine kinase
VRWRWAVGCWLTAVGLLVAVPLAARADSESGLDVPSAADPRWWIGLAVVTVQAGLVLGRWLPPSARIVVVAVGSPVVAAAGLGDATGVATVAVLVAVFLTVSGEQRDTSWPPLILAALLVSLGEAMQEADGGTRLASAVGGGLVQGVGTVAAALLVGLYVRARREARAAREERTQAVLREQVALTEAAVARERTAMARELHDIAAHHLSGIAVMTGAISRQIDTDPAGAKRAVAEVRTQSTAMLRDLRRLVSLLREDPSQEVGAMVREESLTGIAELVEAGRRSGADVRLSLRNAGDGDGRPLGTGIGPLAQLSAYRTVQEALANAARHAPGARCEVVLEARPDAVLVEISNDAPAQAVPPARSGGGFGLVGMRERAELTGSYLDVGPSPDGGWRVSLRLPRLDPSAGQAGEPAGPAGEEVR